MCTALAGTLGTGNIVGVATAILSGGPGAVFWMWVMALLGMMTSFAENLLGVYYRRRSDKGEWVGGPNVLPAGWAGRKAGLPGAGPGAGGTVCAVLCAGLFWDREYEPDNSIAGNLEAAFGVPPWVSGGVLAVLTGLILAGGLGRVAAVTEKLVPVMALFYLMGAAVILAVHFRAVPEALRAIFAGAFGLEAVGGGAAGYGMAQAVRWGLRRGAFSNEAGLGSAVMVNACADTDEPVQQGMWGIFEVFVDTMLVCTLTALVLLVTEAADPARPPACQCPGGAGVQPGVRHLGAEAHCDRHFVVCLLHRAGVEPLWRLRRRVSAGALGGGAIPGAVCGNDSMGGQYADGSGVEPVRHLQRPDDAAKPGRGAGAVQTGGTDHPELF